VIDDPSAFVGGVGKAADTSLTSADISGGRRVWPVWVGLVALVAFVLFVFLPWMNRRRSLSNAVADVRPPLVMTSVKQEEAKIQEKIDHGKPLEPSVFISPIRYYVSRSDERGVWLQYDVYQVYVPFGAKFDGGMFIGTLNGEGVYYMGRNGQRQFILPGYTASSPERSVDDRRSSSEDVRPGPGPRPGP
jgi:hypothetical protein